MTVLSAGELFFELKVVGCLRILVILSKLIIYLVKTLSIDEV